MVDRAMCLKIKMRKTQITSCPNSINHRKIAVYSIYLRVYRKKISFLVSRHYPLPHSLESCGIMRYDPAISGLSWFWYHVRLAPLQLASRAVPKLPPPPCSTHSRISTRLSIAYYRTRMVHITRMASAAPVSPFGSLCSQG